MPLVWVFRPEATASVALVSTPANWFRASIWSFQANSYAVGVAVPGMMSWNWPPITRVQASVRRCRGYGRAPSHSAATEAFSAASARISFLRFQRFM